MRQLYYLVADKHRGCGHVMRIFVIFYLGNYLIFHNELDLHI